MSSPGFDLRKIKVMFPPTPSKVSTNASEPWVACEQAPVFWFCAQALAHE